MSEYRVQQFGLLHRPNFSDLLRHHRAALLSVHYSVAIPARHSLARRHSHGIVLTGWSRRTQIVCQLPRDLVRSASPTGDGCETSIRNLPPAIFGGWRVSIVEHRAGRGTTSSAVR